jgi:RNA polymerase sigma-70 factor (ECF subfamily)
VSAADDPSRYRDDVSRLTLGDLLYADKTKTPVPEQEWAELVRSVAAGDQRALRALYERMHHIVFTVVMRIAKNRETAEELTVDVFHEIWKRAPRYDASDGTVIGWIMTQARSRAIDRLRFEHRKKRMSIQPDMPEAVTEPPDAFDLREQGRLLRKALSLLTAGERQAIEIAYFSGFTYAEVAERLQQPVGTIKTRIRSGLEKLRRALAKEVVVGR